MNPAISAIIKKDIREITQSSTTFLPLILVPVILTVIIPVGFIILVHFVDPSQINGIDQLSALINSYTIPANLTETMDQILYIFLNYTFLSMFLIVPVMVTAIMGTNAIMGEKERKTLETLLYAPISQLDFLKAKALAALIPGVLVAWISFALLFVMGNGVALILGGPPLVTSPLWIVVLLVMVPALTLVELAVTLLVCIGAKSFMEAQQMSSLVVLPLVALMYSQIAGLVVISPIMVIIISAILVLIALGLLQIAAKAYTREAIIARL